MATSGINSATGNTGMGDGVFTQGKDSDMDKESFMLLLVTQFQHQDPLNPMEDKEFIAQLAQFSALEQQMNTNATMKELVEVQQAQQVISAASYIGRDVSARGFGVSIKTTEKVDDKTGEKTKERTVSVLKYSADGEIASGSFNILDASGAPVMTIQMGAKAPGIHNFEWDGILPNGNKAPDGVYTVTPSAKDAAGAPLPLDTSVSGTVLGVTQYQGSQVLTLTDGRIVALSNVREVLAPTTTVEKPKDDDKEEDKKPPVTPEVTPKPETKPDPTPETPTDPDATDPGTTDPGTTDPGTTDPGTTDPGTTDPGTTDPGTTDPGTTGDAGNKAADSAQAAAANARSTGRDVANAVRAEFEDAMRKASGM